MGTYFVVGAAAFVMVVCLVLAFHKDFHTGLVGNVAFALIAMAGLTRAEGLVSGDHAVAAVPITPISYMLWSGLALYFGQLAWRFAVRLRQRGTKDWYDSGRHHNEVGR